MELVTQCAAVITQSFEIKTPPQVWRESERSETIYGTSPHSAFSPPTIRGVNSPRNQII